MSLQLIGQIAATAAPVIAGAYTSFKANNAAEKENKRKKRLKKLLRNLEASRQPLVNPYENLSVATKAAEMKIEQTDVALANTLDTLRATGAGAGGATALAQAAAQSKKEVASSIETQEVANEQLKAKGEALVWQARETREMQKLDRTAGLLERAQGQQMQYKQDAMGAMMGGAMGAAQIASVMPWDTKSKTTDPDVDPPGKSLQNPTQGLGTPLTFSPNTYQLGGLSAGGGGLNLGGLSGTSGVSSGLNLGGLGVNSSAYNQSVPPYAGMTWDITQQKWVF